LYWNAELEQVIADFSERSDAFTIVRLKENQGLGPTLNAGLPCCKCELIARMDSDDLSLPDRCERQLTCFVRHPEFDIVSVFVTEFSSDPHVAGKTRTVPLITKSSDRSLDLAASSDSRLFPILL
jgi:glycosyltransferase involved in cell wall biosynthesis